MSQMEDDQSFKNPFGDENLEMIKLDTKESEKKNQGSVPPTFESIQDEPKSGRSPLWSMNDSLQGQKSQDNLQATEITKTSSEMNQDGDLPLLQDIGIDLQMIKNRIIMIIKLQQPGEVMLKDPDLCGPVVVALVFGFLLLLGGKIHFGDIYAMFISGNCLLYILFNFMSQNQVIPLYCIMSALGYSLLPMWVLGFLDIFLSLQSAVGIIVSLSVAVWSSIASGNIVYAWMGVQISRKWLVVYPLFLFYACFSMIVIF